jgi:hypothetical protein
VPFGKEKRREIHKRKHNAQIADLTQNFLGKTKEEKQREILDFLLVANRLMK